MIAPKRIQRKHTKGCAELAGRDLACWCPLDFPCHGDVLLELANGPDEDTGCERVPAVTHGPTACCERCGHQTTYPKDTP